MIDTQTVSGGDATPLIEYNEAVPPELVEGTVSGGDNIADVNTNDILFELQAQAETMENISDAYEQQTQTIWEKPIEEYTPTEGLLLILTILAIGAVIFKIVGGIICVK